MPTVEDPALRKEYYQKHYDANKSYYYERNLKRRLEMREYITNLKSVPCMDCGKSYHPVVMDFDHRDPSLKENTISVLERRGGWKKLKAEIDKCDIVCSNCHRLRTHLK